MRVVFDTNVVVSSVLSGQGVPAQLVRRWRTKGFDLVVSSSVLAEYGRALSYSQLRPLHGLDDVAIAQTVDDFRQEALVVEPPETLAVVEQDESDNRFFECAVAGEAEVIVSGDRHLLGMGEYRGIRVLTPAAFIAYLDSLNARPQ